MPSRYTAPPVTATLPSHADSNLHAQLASRLRAHGGELTSWFPPDASVTVAVAPGRLDVIGGIADYSGATVLEATIGPQTVVAMHRRDDHRIRVTTVGPEAGDLDGATFDISVGETRLHAGALRARIGQASRWASYVVGAWHVLFTEGIASDLPGADVAINGGVPLGAGVASSAALEVATMRALCAIAGISLDGLRLAALCQMVEQRVAGAPCGIMDQVTCALGEAGRLLELRCQPHDLLGHVAIPPGVAIFGLDSGVKHAVGGARYPRVRAAAFMGREILRSDASGEAIDLPGGHLCNLNSRDFKVLSTRLPRRMRGRDFLDAYGDHHDDATTIDPAAEYPVRGATIHPITEQARVLRFRRALILAATTTGHTRATALASAGRQMYGAHRSYSRNCGLGATETDRIVALVRAEGPANGLHGAKITGGGSGGTVAVIADAQTDGSLSDASAEAIARVLAAAGASNGRVPRVIAGSSPGAVAIPPLTRRWVF
jgi:galactokinase